MSSTISIIKKEVIQNLRDKRSMILLILFPMLLIFILGSAFSNNFSSSVDLKGIKVFYSITGKGEDINSFKTFQRSLEKELKINFVLKDKEKGIEEIEAGRHACFIIYDSDNKKIDFYKNSRASIESGIMEVTLKAYADDFNASYEIYKNRSEMINSVNHDDKENYVKISSFNAKKSPSSFDYYSITMLTMSILYGMYTGAFAMKGEKLGKTSLRLYASPVSRRKLLFGKLIGCFIMSALQITLVLLFSKYIMNVNLGDDVLSVVIVLLSLSLFTLTMGLGLSYMIKRTSLLTGIITFIVPLMVFFAGGYMPLSDSLDFIAYFSPVKWVNQSIFDIIYKKSYALMPKTIIVCLVLSFAFIVVTTYLFKGEEGIADE